MLSREEQSYWNQLAVERKAAFDALVGEEIAYLNVQMEVHSFAMAQNAEFMEQAVDLAARAGAHPIGSIFVIAAGEALGM